MYRRLEAAAVSPAGAADGGEEKGEEEEEAAVDAHGSSPVQKVLTGEEVT